MKLLRAAMISALLIVALACAPAQAQQPAEGEIVAFTVNTQDGIIVLHGPLVELLKLRDRLASELAPGATNSSLASFLSSAGLPPSVSFDMFIPAGITGESRPVQMNRIETTVRQAEAEGRIPPIGGRELFEAYTLIRMRGDSFMLIGEAPPAAPPLKHSVFVLSSSFGFTRDGIFIDGVNRSPGKVGYNFVTLSPDGDSIIGADGFETYADNTAGGKMQAFLEAQPQGSIALGSIRVGPGVFITGGAIGAMSQYGSASEPNPQIVSSHAMIGVRGMRPGTAVEASEVNGNSLVVIFKKDIYVPPDALAALEAAPGSRLIAVSGTAPDDRIIIVGSEF